jgi:serine/threonine-protein kinase RsbT
MKPKKPSLNMKGKIEISNKISYARTQSMLRELSLSLGFNTTETTCIVVVALELLRYLINYSDCTSIIWEKMEEGTRKGIKLEFEDKQRIIPNVGQTIEVGANSGDRLGIALSAAKVLMDEFEITNTEEKGRKVIIKKWS